MGTDAGTDTSEKASIGGCTSLTQLDTWLEAMDGETLCLTGKVTDCWQPVDGAQENASFYLKDLSIEADASSFVFSGDSAETTDNLSQISGSADADQMSILISSQKTTSQINEMQEIFGKNASALCYLQEDEALPRAGSYVRVLGEVSPFLQATNPGEFDAAAYYRRKDCLFALRKTKITAQTKNYGRLEEFLSQLRYESEVLFRKLLGEKNGATASAMVLGRKKGMDSEVKALYQGAGISHLLAISGLHLSLIGAGLFGLLKKVRLPVALSAGISTWILIVYAQLTGMGISTRRALVMFLLFLAAGLLKRTPDLPTSLAVAALLLLVPKPQRILDAGFQLSFSAVLGIAVMIPVLQDGWEEAAPSLRVTDGVAGWNLVRAAIARACRLLRKNILAGLGITMTMLPFLLIHFYEWSPWSVLLNLAVIPLMGILLPCLIGLQLVARLTAFVHCLEIPQHLLCTAIEAIFSCYEQLCRFTTALPGSILHTGYPTWQALAVYTIGLIALAVSGKKLRPHLRLAAAVCLMGIFLIRLPGELNVTMLDVGQGECVGIETREHHVYLVDAGSTSKKKTGQYQIIPWLKYIGTRSVEGIFITHWDEDHISAVGELLEWSKSSRVKIRRIFLPDVALKDEVLETLLQQIEEAEVSVEYLSAGEHMTDGALQISCLHPYAKKSAGGSQRCVAGAAPVTGRFSDAADRRSGKERRRLAGRAGATRRGAAPARCAGTGTPVCTVNPACCAKSPPLHHPRRRAPRRVQRDGRSTAGFGTAGAGPDFLRQKQPVRASGAGNAETPGRAGNPLVFHGGGRRDTGVCWKEKSENRNKSEWTKISHIELKNTKKRLRNKREKTAEKARQTIKRTETNI